jgi:hypothetical protein
MTFADSPMTPAEESALVAWNTYAAAVESFRDLVQAHAGRHEMLRQHEKLIRAELKWKHAYCALLIPAGRETVDV